MDRAMAVAVAVGGTTTPGPAWRSCTVTPAIVAVPRRGSPVFGATARRTAALPAPSPGTTRLTQATSVRARQAHPPGEVTLTVTSAPEASTSTLDGVTV